ncbi:hypothetical protein CsSME_00019215 [Camellia sinensis var. sinensis]
MNAFKAYKACVPIAWSRNLYITLVSRLHRRTLGNTPTVRGMLQQVKRLVVIETEEMYKARKQKDANHQALRPPFVVSHLPAAASDSSQ